MCRKDLIVFCFLSFILNLGLAQNTPDHASFEKLKSELKDDARRRQERIDAYVEKTKKPSMYRDVHGNLVLLVDITDSGVPIYKTTDNASAAVTVGADQLRSSGSLGVNLQGNEMVVAIWDGGIVKGHIELGDRVLSTQGASDDTHATHVAGTIMASGINPSAKGMAPLAKAYTFDFNNDESEMMTLATPDESSILLSNHSYGIVSGWRFETNWQWFGDNSVSSQEDYKFGFYTSGARQWDQIAFNAPYYTICKSAGNDRSDVGSGGSHPPDCDGGSGYDCISDASTSKNIITVGAVEKVNTYVDASSVKMSSFSSWGPTDDGRIKPDIVAAGVNVFSLSATGTNQYTSLSGTSMSTPNTTGALLLVQEIYKKLHADKPMKSATLKALAIHTAKEAGLAEGPDYKFGWGLLDVASSSRLILEEDNKNVFIKELSLNQGNAIEIPISPKANTKVVATLVWSDPAGTSPSVSLDPTNLMLVNDLDMRIVSANEEYSPWILDPADPSVAATKGDNFRDNVEKIEFVPADVTEYSLQITHKGNLRDDHQDFSVIISLVADNTGKKLYWIGNSTDWNSPSNWSLTSGGSTAGIVPGPDDMVFFDENSFQNGFTDVSLSNDVECSSVVWFSESPSSFVFNQHSLTVRDNFKMASNAVTAADGGKIIFSPQSFDEKSVSMRNNDFSGVEFEFEGASSWKLTGQFNVGGVTLKSGELNIEGLTLNTKALTINSADSKTLLMQNAILSGIENSLIDSNNLTLSSGSAQLNTSTSVNSEIDWRGVVFDGSLFIHEPLTKLSGNSTYSNVGVNGELQIYGNNSINTLNLNAGSSLKLAGSTIQQLTQNTNIASSEALNVNLNSLDAQNAFLNFSGYYKLCFDHLNIENVESTGTAIINAGLNSSVVNSPNWLQEDCEDVLFPEFTYEFNCLGSIVEFTDLSSGAITNWSWDFDDVNPDFEKSDVPNGRHIFKTAGIYNVSLTISNANSEATFSQEIEITNNDLPDNQIVLSNNRLFSVKTSTSYQWYKNSELIDGAIDRAFDFLGEEGIYVVAIKGANCNRISTPYTVTDIDEYLSHQNGVKIFPNPVPGSQFTMQIEETLLPARVKLYDYMGRQLKNFTVNDPEVMVERDGIKPGIYNLLIETKKGTIYKRIVVE